MLRVGTNTYKAVFEDYLESCIFIYSHTEYNIIGGCAEVGESGQTVNLLPPG